MIAPTPLDATVTDILRRMSAKHKLAFMTEPEGRIGACFGFLGGMALRNDLDLWFENTPLTKWFTVRGVLHGDDRSQVIIKAMWCRLNGKPLDIAAQGPRGDLKPVSQVSAGPVGPGLQQGQQLQQPSRSIEHLFILTAIAD